MQRIALCVLDSTASMFGLCAFKDGVCHTMLEMVLRQLWPKEIVFTKLRSAHFVVWRAC